MNRIFSTKKLAVIAVLVAQAVVLHYLESFFPNPVPIPGVKLGLANIITLLALVAFDFKTALEIVLLRTVIGSLLSGTLFGVGFLMSLSGALAAACMMVVVLRFFPSFSLIGVSVAGAAVHNLGQLAMAALIIRHSGILYYLPAMLLFSVPTGIITGILLTQIIKFLKSTNRFDSLFYDQ